MKKMITTLMIVCWWLALFTNGCSLDGCKNCSNDPLKCS